jgi:hypothetical protein
VLFSSQILVVAVAVFGINVMPAFAPPTWAVLTYFRFTDGLPIWLLVVVGALSAAAGRYILAMEFRALGSHLPNRRRESLEALGTTLSGRRGLLATVVLFMVSPIPSNTLFEAAGLARIQLRPLLAAFSASRPVSYSVLLISASAAQGGIRGVVTGGVTSPWAIGLGLLGLAGLVALVRIDWVGVIDRARARRARRKGEPPPPSIRVQLGPQQDLGGPGSGRRRW